MAFTIIFKETGEEFTFPTPSGGKVDIDILSDYDGVDYVIDINEYFETKRKNVEKYKNRRNSI